MEKVDLLVHSAAQLLTLAGGPQRGARLGTLNLIQNGAIAIKNQRIAAAGTTNDLQSRYKADKQFDASGQVVMPGFVDSHTHLVWAGDRSHEFEMRVSGASYLQIMAGGGGIASTVEKTREARLEQLLAEARPRLQRMLCHGTTSLEAKTGYGLELGAELRLLEAILRLDEESPADISPTFLGAHAIPPEFAGKPDRYTALICHQMLPRIMEWWQENAGHRPLPFVDAFCEAGAFDLQQTRRILEKAKSLGFPLKIHADEFESLGGTKLAVCLGATSADHLVSTPMEDLQALGQSDTVAVALPCTPFGLAEGRYTPAHQILRAGGILAIATDINPGTAWCENMQLAMAVACRYMSLTPAQVIAAATINGAAAIGREDRIGSLEPGKQADLIVLEVPDYRHLGYRFGTNLVSLVVKKGNIVFGEME